MTGLIPRSAAPSGRRKVLRVFVKACLVAATATATATAPPAQAAPIPVGSGPESATVVVNFSDGAVSEFVVSYATPTTTGEQLLRTIDAARTDFSFTGTDYSGFLLVDRIEHAGRADGPGYTPPEGFWHYWLSDGPAAPWTLAEIGASTRTIDDGYRDGWVFGRATAPVPEPAGLAAVGLLAAGLLARRRRRGSAPGRAIRPWGLALGVVGCGTVVAGMAARPALAAHAYDPADFAVEVVSSTGPFGAAPYDSPQAVLGRPTLRFNSSFNPSTPDLRRAKLIEATFNTGPAGEKLITTLGTDSQITVRMGRPVTNDPANPFGIDLVVFGNAFYSGSGGFGSDATNLNTYTLGGLSAENTKVSVSPDGVTWYRYDGGPYADAAFPTNSYRWDRAAAAWTEAEMDPTRPVNPALAASVAGRTAADVLENVYAGSAGGTGFDLAGTGFQSVQFIRVEGLSGFTGGEIDAVADVRPVPEPAGLAALATVAGPCLLGRRRRLR